MRLLIPATGVLLFASAALAAVSATVYLADEQTPLPFTDPNTPGVYRDIMAGTRLTIFVSSDTNEPWSGRFWHSWENAAIGAVAGRDGDPNTLGYGASVLPAAGERNVRVADFANQMGTGLDLLPAREAVPGEWFVVDYHARAVGDCELGLYEIKEPGDQPVDWFPGLGEEPPPAQFVAIQGFTFHHVPSRDFHPDHLVNFADFAVLAGAWQAVPLDPNEPDASTSEDPNQPGPPAPQDTNVVLNPDLNADGVVGAPDLALFCEYWLERTDVNEPPTDPNELPVDPSEPGAGQ
jgi:hypothetical protein